VSKSFDATTRHLLEIDPRAWLRLVGVETALPIEVVNADLSTVTSQADEVLRVDDAQPWLVHIEFQSSYEASIPLRLARYNVLLEYRHRTPVLSVVLLLRPEADGPGLTGLLHRSLPDGFRYDEFNYRVVRSWNQSLETLLSGGLGTLPLAPLADVALEQLPAVVSKMEERLRQEASPSEAADLWASTYLLMGLRYPRSFIQQLLRGVRNMKESTTYQAILQEGIELGIAKGKETGVAEEAKRVLLRLGTKRFGPPGPKATAAIESLSDVKRLEQLTDRLLDVASWDELLS
jgi:predicted transposase YdaD